MKWEVKKKEKKFPLQQCKLTCFFLSLAAWSAAASELTSAAELESTALLDWSGTGGGGGGGGAAAVTAATATGPIGGGGGPALLPTGA